MPETVVVGAGPAGAAVALMLANAGHAVTLLERQRDFAREFRGEILMPSGADVLDLMALDDWRHQVVHQAQSELTLYLNRTHILSESITAPAAVPLAISQPDFLEYLINQADRHPNFRFISGAHLHEIKMSRGRVSGVIYRVGMDRQTIPCDVLIGADGRNSKVRKTLGFETQTTSPPMDIVWFKLPPLAHRRGLSAYVSRGHLAILYQSWDGNLQMAWIILKGTFGELRDRGIEAWAQQVCSHVDEVLADHIEANLENLQHPFLLDSVSDCVTTWHRYGGLLIGDAAHTMSPVGAQGINIALRDAYVTARELNSAYAHKATPARLDAAFAKIESLRMAEVKPIQALQARPPKVVLSQKWWGEVVRRSAAKLLTRPAIRHRATRVAQPLIFGLTDIAED